MLRGSFPIRYVVICIHSCLKIPIHPAGRSLYLSYTHVSRIFKSLPLSLYRDDDRPHRSSLMHRQFLLVLRRRVVALNVFGGNLENRDLRSANRVSRERERERNRVRREREFEPLCRSNQLRHLVSTQNLHTYVATSVCIAIAIAISMSVCLRA